MLRGYTKLMPGRYSAGVFGGCHVMTEITANLSIVEKLNREDLVSKNRVHEL